MTRFDTHLIAALVTELREKVLGARIEKIHHIPRDALLFYLRTREGSFKLLLRANPGTPRLLLMEEPPPPPGTPTALCMLLRKHLQGAVITDIRQEGTDRAVTFTFRATDTIGDPVTLLLRAEYFGRHQNLILTYADNTIIDAVRRFSIDESTRPILPGLKWSPAAPPQNAAVLLKNAAMLPIMHDLELLYRERDTQEAAKQRSAELMKLLDQRIARAVRTLEARKGELAQAEDRESLRLYGELIRIHQTALEAGTLQRGSRYYLLENPYDNNREIRIPADPALTPSANAARYFKRYQKAKNAEEKLRTLLAESENELEYLENARESLSRNNSSADLDNLRKELEDLGIVKRHNTKSKPKHAKPLPPLEYRTADGLRILCGRSNAQNEFLSLKGAAKTDFWFHVQNLPGSHVVLCCEGQNPPSRSIEQAAGVAAYQSAARTSHLVNVDYTPVRQLRKPPGSPPGKVIYHTHKTLLVSPALPC